MSVIKVKNEEGEFVDISIIQGKDGTSVACVKVGDEETALQQSTSNPNNIYYW